MRDLQKDNEYLRKRLEETLKDQQMMDQEITDLNRELDGANQEADDLSMAVAGLEDENMMLKEQIFKLKQIGDMNE